MSYTIHKASEEDVQDILDLIIELAIYEKEPDATKATSQQIKDNVISGKYAGCLIARTPATDGGRGEAVGMALYFFSFSTWLGIPGLYLEDLFVKSEHRGKGLGKRLFGGLGSIAKERGCGRVEWRVLKWNKPSIAFYTECLKAENLSEWDTMRLEGDEAIERLIEFRQ